MALCLGINQELNLTGDNRDSQPLLFLFFYSWKNESDLNRPSYTVYVYVVICALFPLPHTAQGLQH